MYYEINESLAKRCKEMMSFSGYIPNTATDRYRADVDRVKEVAENAKSKFPDFSEKIDILFDKYCRKMADYINKDNEIGCRCPSIMITGASNFPIRKKEKQVEAWNKLHETYKGIQNIVEQIKDIGYGSTIIKSNDENAIELLQKKVNTLTALQEKMKAANAYYRKHKTIRGFDGLSDEEATKIDTRIENDYSWCKAPFPSYELTNNNACIKQAQTRLDSLLKKKEQGTSEIIKEGFKVIENVDIDRLQIVFDGKPSESIRNILKSNGFKWAPSQNAWQRQLTPNAKYALNKVLEVI